MAEIIVTIRTELHGEMEIRRGFKGVLWGAPDELKSVVDLFDEVRERIVAAYSVGVDVHSVDCRCRACLI